MAASRDAFATSFCFWGTWAPVYALTAELAPRRAMGLAFGVLNSVAFTASLVAPFVTGWIKDWSGSFAGGCYLAALLGLPAVPVALAVGSPRLRRSARNPASLMTFVTRQAGRSRAGWDAGDRLYTGAVSRPGRLASLLVAPLVGLACPWAGAQEVVEATLDNGLRVLLQEDHRSPVASFQIWYRVGSRDERIGLTGLSHYLEHMMFKGTPTYGPGVFSKLVETVGGQDNAFTSRDVTVYHVTVAAEQLDLVLELEADRMRHLLLAPREVDAERKVVMEERRTRTEDDPVGALAELFNTVAFAAHPYRLPTIGLAQDIERLTASDLRSWYETYYRPNNAIVAVVGDFRAGELLEKIRTRFGAIPRGPDPPRVAVVEPEQRGERRVWLRKEAQLPVVFARLSGAEPPIGGRLPSRGPVDRPLRRADVAALPAARVRGAACPRGRRRLPAPHARSRTRSPST